MGSLYVTSAGLADYTRERAELLARADDLFGALKSGAVRVSVNARYPLAEAAQAHRDLEARGARWGVRFWCREASGDAVIALKAPQPPSPLVGEVAERSEAGGGSCGG